MDATNVITKFNNKFSKFVRTPNKVDFPTEIEKMNARMVILLIVF